MEQRAAVSAATDPPSKEANLDQLIAVAAASFTGTLAALIVARLFSALTVTDNATAPDGKPLRTPNAYTLIAGGGFLIMTVNILNSISAGDLAPGLGVIALTLALGTALVVGRALRR